MWWLREVIAGLFVIIGVWWQLSNLTRESLHVTYLTSFKGGGHVSPLSPLHSPTHLDTYSTFVTLHTLRCGIKTLNFPSSSKQISKIAMQQQALGQLQAGLVDELESKGTFKDPETQKIMEKYEKVCFPYQCSLIAGFLYSHCLFRIFQQDCRLHFIYPVF